MNIRIILLKICTHPIFESIRPTLINFTQFLRNLFQKLRSYKIFPIKLEKSSKHKKHKRHRH